jgi:hypothetical protein
MKKCILAIVCAVGLSCVNYPADERELYEMESVWQYLQAYSIWQERIPQDPFQYATPEKMLYSIMDTLKGAHYTEYSPTPCGACRGSAARAGRQSDNIDTLEWMPLGDSTALLKIREFTDITYQYFLTTIIAMDNVRHFRNIVIDLCGNGGGDIKSTDSIINAILPRNTPFLIETYREYNDKSRLAKTISMETQITQGPQHWALQNKRYAVLVDGYTASASEMLTTALKEGFSQAGRDSTVIIGATTFGKGIGQICIPRQFMNHADLKITFMRMKGLVKVGDYHGKGIKPDILSLAYPEQVVKAFQYLEPSAKMKKLSALWNSAAPPALIPPEAVAEPVSNDRPLSCGE